MEKYIASFFSLVIVRGACVAKPSLFKVHLGLNLDTGELIAVKQISLEGQQDKEVEAIEYEVRLLRNLRHESKSSINLSLSFVPFLLL
jgi:hypothetical protein